VIGTNEGLGHGTSIQVTWRGSTFKQGKTNLVSSGVTWHLCIEIKGKKKKKNIYKWNIFFIWFTPMFGSPW
jgi:hypothetical protein